MKLLTIILIGLIIFTAIYTIIIFTSDFGIPNTIDYIDNPPCEFEQFEDGSARLENCAVYKVIKNSGRIRIK